MTEPTGPVENKSATKSNPGSLSNLSNQQPPPNTDICPTCSSKVYFAEQVFLGGYKYHKQCFKCCVCNKLVDSTTVNEKGAILYCKTCYQKTYGDRQ